MEFLLIYLYIALFNLSEMLVAFIPLGIFCVMGAVALTFASTVVRHDIDTNRVNNSTDNTNLADSLDRYRKSCIKFSVVFFFTLILLSSFVPTKEQIAWIVGGGVAWNVAQNEEVRKLPENVASSLNRFLESVNIPDSDQIKEGVKNKAEEVIVGEE